MTAARLQAPSLVEILKRQHGVASRAQLREHGIDRFAVMRHVKALRWQLCGPRVVATHTGPLRRVERQWAAVLHSGAAARLAGLTAAEAAGLKGWEREPVHVVVPKGFAFRRCKVW